jgi:hypothetical protein
MPSTPRWIPGQPGHPDRDNPETHRAYGDITLITEPACASPRGGIFHYPSTRAVLSRGIPLRRGEKQQQMTGRGGGNRGTGVSVWVNFVGFFGVF